MRDLLVELDPDMRPRLSLEHELRAAIRSGRLAAGTTLPSTRTLAVDLGIARSTVVAAYEQLAVEGYLTAKQGQATRVAAVSVPDGSAEDKNPFGSQPAHDFRPGEPTVGSFPRREWQRSLRRSIADAPDDAFGYGDPRGRLELRGALAAYLARARTVHVEPAAVRIYTGFSSALGFIGETFRRRGIDHIAVEKPMLPFHQQILELVGLTTHDVPIDEEGLCVEQLYETGAKAVLVTPANQQPLGITMSSARRNELVTWAESVDGWIIEDDYDGEFRYDRRPIGALQGLNADRVLYAGTASKSMGPGMHLGWLVVPAELRRDLAAVTHLRAGVSTVNQLALADFLERGAYDRHVRQQRRLYRQRRDGLGQQLEAVPWLEIQPGEAGMHLVGLISDEAVSEGALIARAWESSVGLTGLQTHFGHHQAGLVLNVSRPPEHHYATAVSELLAALLSIRGRRRSF